MHWDRALCGKCRMLGGKWGQDGTKIKCIAHSHLKIHSGEKSNNEEKVKVKDAKCIGGKWAQDEPKSNALLPGKHPWMH